MKMSHLKIVEAIPTRLTLWIMMFSSCWVAYMLRVNMSVNIIAMVNSTQHSDHGISNSSGMCTMPASEKVNINSTEEVKIVSRNHKGPTFDWDSKAQGLILGAYFYGYLVTLIGGPVAERWGPRKVVGVTTICSALLTALSVPAAHMHWGVLVGVRAILGLLGGFTYPALHTLIASWIPTAEKGKFISSLMGGVLGTVATWSLSGFIMDEWGWEMAFYIPAAISLIWSILWFCLIYDSPAAHPRISSEERKYIEDALGNALRKEKLSPPIWKMFTSLPYISMVVLHFGNMWGLFFIMTAAPLFMSKVLNFNIKEAGVLSALPYLARLILAFVFGLIGDFLLKRKLLSVTATRKTFILFSHIIPGIMLVCLIFAGCNRPLIVALITMSMGWNGAATLTNLANHQDLAPNFAGTLYGIANFFGGFTGFVSPLIVAYYTKEKNGLDEWKPVFIIGASVYLLCALFFLLFGTGETQDWNFPNNQDPTKQEKKVADIINNTQTSVVHIKENGDKSR